MRSRIGAGLSATCEFSGRIAIIRFRDRHDRAVQLELKNQPTNGNRIFQTIRDHSVKEN